MLYACVDHRLRGSMAGPFPKASSLSNLLQQVEAATSPSSSLGAQSQRQCREGIMNPGPCSEADRGFCINNRDMPMAASSSSSFSEAHGYEYSGASLYQPLPPSCTEFSIGAHQQQHQHQHHQHQHQQHHHQQQQQQQPQQQQNGVLGEGQSSHLSYLPPSTELPQYVPSSPSASYSMELGAGRPHGYDPGPQSLYRGRVESSAPPYCEQQQQVGGGGGAMSAMGLTEPRHVGSGSLPSSTRPERSTQFCAVCSDYASGYHYGVWSCEGCKAFFKRSTQGHNDYMCPATNQCTIDRNRRKSCQACRLRKCYEVGMVKGVRKDRKGFRGVKHKRQRPIPQKNGGGVGGGGQDVSVTRPQGERPTGPRDRESTVTSLEADQVISALLEAEPPTVLSSYDPDKPVTEASLMAALTSLADRELVHMITWAKKIPGFTAIGLSDQVQLLECCWLEILIVGLIWRSIDRPGQLHFAPNLILGREDARNVEGMLDMFDMLLVTVSRFRELHLRREEYVCLKAMILLNSGVFFCLSNSAGEQTNVQLIQQILEKVMDALGSTIGHIEASPPQHSRRLSQLLLLLSQIRHISNKGIEHLNSMKRKNVIPLYDLLLELLDAHSLQNTGLRTSPPPQDFRATSNSDGDVAAQPGEQEYQPYVAADFKALHQPESREFRTHADRPYLGGGHANRGPVATVTEPEVRPQHEREFRVHTQRGFRDHVEREFITLGKSTSASSEAGGPVTFTSKSLMF
ncbi:estrogen receptor-like [Lampetra fluviatilis]